MSSLQSLPNISNFYILQIIDNDPYFKSNNVIVPKEWFFSDKSKLFVFYPPPPRGSTYNEDLSSNESFIKNSTHQVIPESWKKYL